MTWVPNLDPAPPSRGGREVTVASPHDSIQSGDEGEEIQEEESQMAGRRSESFRGLQNPTHRS